MARLFRVIWFSQNVLPPRNRSRPNFSIRSSRIWPRRKVGAECLLVCLVRGPGAGFTPRPVEQGEFVFVAVQALLLRRSRRRGRSTSG